MHTSPLLLHLLALFTLALLPTCSPLPLGLEVATTPLQPRQDTSLVHANCCPSCGQDCSVSSGDPNQPTSSAWTDNSLQSNGDQGGWKEKRDPSPSPTPGEADAFQQLQDVAKLMARDHAEVLQKRQNSSMSGMVDSFLHTDTMKKFILTAGSFALKEVSWAMNPSN